MRYGILLWLFFAVLLVPFDRISQHVNHGGFYSILRIDAADDMGYYAPLVSMLSDGDVDLSNEPRFWYREHKTATGYAHAHWGIGSAILWLPWFLLGHVLALFLHTIQPAITVDGWSFPYLVCTGAGAAFYTLMGMLVCRRLYRLWFSGRAATLAALGVTFASPLLYYTYIRNRYSHSGEFFLVALTYWLLASGGSALLNGVAAGMLLCIRPNTLVLAAPVAWIRRREWQFWAGAILGAAPQLLVWHLTFGRPWPDMSLFKAAPGNLFRPWVAVLQQWQVFTSPDWGLVWSMPVFVLGLIGLAILGLKAVRQVAGYQVLAALYVVGAYNASWTTQSAYGWRLLICALPAIGVGLAYLADRFPRGFSCAVVLAVIQQYLYVAAYKIALPYDHPRFSLAVLGFDPSIHIALFPRSSSLLTFLGAKVGWLSEPMVLPIITLTAAMFIFGGWCACKCYRTCLQRSNPDPGSAG